MALGIAQFAGCQQSGLSSGNWWNPLAGLSRHRPPFPSPTPPVKLTSAQKADVEMALARTLENKGYTDRAIKTYLEVIRKDSRRADAHHRLAVLYDKKGECAKAEEHYRATLKRDPNSSEAYCDFGYSCYLQQRWQEAETHFRKSLSLNPEMKRAHNNLGLLLARRGNSAAALQEFQRAGCAEAEARANLAFMMMFEDRWEEAQGQFELALAADPSSEVARKGLNSVRSLAGNSQRDQPVLAASRVAEGTAAEGTAEVSFVSENGRQLQR